MKNILLLVVFVVLVLSALLFALYNQEPEEKQQELVSDYKNATYSIDGKSVTLTDGVSEVSLEAGSSAVVVTRYFGNELFKDLNNDGREDVVFLLTQETGGSGTFFYAVAALNTEGGYVGSDGYFLGDRIAPQTTEVSRNPRHINVIVVNYADRGPEEPMTTQPSFGKSAYLKLDTEFMQWGIVEPDFEGEADTEIKQ